MKLYDVRNQLWTAIAIMDGSTEWWYPIFELNIPNLQIGEVVQLAGEQEFRNNAGDNVELIAAYCVKNSPLGGVQTNQSGFIMPLSGNNVTPAAHYGVPLKVFNYKSTLSGSVWFHYMARARWSINSGVQNLDVMAGQGYLQALRLGLET